MYDGIFVGGGLNYAGAIVMAKRGKKVALIEKNLNELGGICLHHGCIPSKNLLHRTKTISEIRENVFKSHKDPLELTVLQNKINKHIQDSAKAVTLQCKSAGVELIEGEAFVVENGVDVNDTHMDTRYVIIGTGSSTFVPKGIKINSSNIITSKEALKLEKLPKEIIIYGSGAIGLEFASFFSLNGVKTTIVYRHDKISNKIHPQIVRKIEEQLKNNGVILMPENSIINAQENGDEVEISFENGKKTKTQMLLVATGRRANIDMIKTDKIEMDKKIITDEYFQTSLENVFAIGDCNGKLQLAHAARAEVLNVVDNITKDKEVLNLSNIPKFIYTLPLSYAFIGNRGIKEVSFSLSYLGISGAVEESNKGEVILYLDENDFISGAEFFTPYAEELIGIVSTALAGEMDVNTFKKAVFPHPTFSESIDRVLRKV